MTVATSSLSASQAREVIARFVEQFVVGTDDIVRVRLARESDGVVLIATVAAGSELDLPPTFSEFGMPIRIETGEPVQLLVEPAYL
jgi:hypothetical protein